MFYGQTQWFIYGGFLKWGYPQIIHFRRIFPYKPSIWGYPVYGHLHMASRLLPYLIVSKPYETLWNPMKPYETLWNPSNSCFLLLICPSQWPPPQWVSPPKAQRPGPSWVATVRPSISRSKSGGSRRGGSMGKAWENHGGKSSIKHGNLWKTHGNSWKTHGKLWKLFGGNPCKTRENMGKTSETPRSLNWKLIELWILGEFPASHWAAVSVALCQARWIHCPETLEITALPFRLL